MAFFMKLKKFGYNDTFFILTPLGFCPIFFGYRFSSIIFFLWAIFFTILRTYFFIKVQNDLNRAKLHLEYLYEIYLLENKQNNLE